MIQTMRISDQYYDWSEIRYRKNLDTHLAAAEETAYRTSAALGVGVVRFADRAVQALRQAEMQVCPRSGPWAEVLPFCQSVGIDPANGLCSLRISTAGAGVFGELPSDTRHSQAGLRHQPRAVAATAATLVGLSGECARCCITDRLCSRPAGRCAGRQHAPELFAPSKRNCGAKR